MIISLPVPKRCFSAEFANFHVRHIDFPNYPENRKFAEMRIASLNEIKKWGWKICETVKTACRHRYFDGLFNFYFFCTHMQHKSASKRGQCPSPSPPGSHVQALLRLSCYARTSIQSAWECPTRKCWLMKKNKQIIAGGIATIGF